MKRFRPQSPIIPVVAVVGLVFSACNHNETSGITLKIGKAERIQGCHVMLDLVRVHERDIAPIADFRYACGVSESALNQERWWGDQTEPLMFSMYAGDCVRLDKTFYCVENIKPETSASLRATYEVKHRTGDLIQRIR